ncbi:hypothetical protein [Haloferax elongans]|uniref:hypothetical protein n=1 Tax=Haloferax elongans TaxID=403191 RepID=UPI000677AA4D|nr:hypothetical protein [Haloferax elongans]
MSGRQHSVELDVLQPPLRAAELIPLVVLAFLCGVLGWLVWEPLGVFLGVLPPAVVFGFAYQDSRKSAPPGLPAPDSTTPLALDGRVDLTASLRAANVFSAESSETPSLSEQFRSKWRTNMVEMDDREHDVDALADLLGVSHSRVELVWDERGLVARLDDGEIGRWTSRAAFVADLTAVTTFRRQYPAWWRLSTPDRNRVLGALRLSLQQCPTCDGDVFVEKVRTNGTTYRVTATCRGCDAELFDAEMSGSDSGVSETEPNRGPAQNPSS